jgi:hypothetical protein
MAGIDDLVLATRKLIKRLGGSSQHANVTLHVSYGFVVSFPVCAAAVRNFHSVTEALRLGAPALLKRVLGRSCFHVPNAERRFKARLFARAARTFGAECTVGILIGLRRGFIPGLVRVDVRKSVVQPLLPFGRGFLHHRRAGRSLEIVQEAGDNGPGGSVCLCQCRLIASAGKVVAAFAGHCSQLNLELEGCRVQVVGAIYAIFTNFWSSPCPAMSSGMVIVSKVVLMSCRALAEIGSILWPVLRSSSARLSTAKRAAVGSLLISSTSTRERIAFLGELPA